MTKLWKFSLLCLCALAFTACSDDDDWNKTGDGRVTIPSSSRAFILNEGSFGASNSNIIYFDWKTGVVDSLDLYVRQNGGGLGDTGNDILTVGNNKVVVAVNGSNYVALLDGYGVERSEISFNDYPNLGQVRCLTEEDGYIYATSTGGYVSRIRIKGNELSYVDSLKIQPHLEGIAEEDGRLYVAVQGTAYTDCRLAIVEKDFQTVSYDTIMVNPNKVYEEDGKIFITGYGAYYDNPCGVYDPATRTYTDLGHASAAAKGDGVIYTAYSATDWTTYQTSTFLNTYNVKTGMNETFFQNEPEALTTSTVYSISYNPYNRKVYVATTDYYSPGVVYVFGADGKYESSFSTYGVNPNKIVFLK